MDTNSQHLKDEVPGLEVLTLEGVELLRREAGKNYFIGVGALSVLYIEEYGRFIVYLNDWAYGLVTRIPVTCVHNSTQFCYFVLPSYNSSYVLKIKTEAYPAALKNFVTILKNNSNYSEEEQTAHFTGNRKSQLLKGFVNNYFQSTPKDQDTTSSMDFSDVKYDSLSVQDLVTRGFKKFTNKIKVNSSANKSNPKMTSLYEYSHLKKMTHDLTFVHSFVRKDVEAIIIRSKDIATKLGYEDTYTGDNHNIPPRSPSVRASEHLRPSLQESASPANSVFYSSNNNKSIESPKQASVHRSIYTPKTYSNTSSQVFSANKENLRTSQTLTDAEFLREEMRILIQIEKERQFQLEAKKYQVAHREREELLVDQERIAMEKLRKLLKSQDPRQKEESLQFEISMRDAQINRVVRLRESEHKEFEDREKSLVSDLQWRLSEIKRRENLLELEKKDFERREAELIEYVKLKDIKEGEMIEAKKIEIEELARNLENQFREQENQVEFAKIELRNRENELLVENDRKLVEIAENQRLIEQEFADFVNRETELKRLFDISENERKQLEKNKKALRNVALDRFNELTEKQVLAERELEEIAMKRQELQASSERMMIEIQQKAQMTDLEREGLIKKQQELKSAFDSAEGEVLSLILREQRLQQKVQEKEEELLKRLQYTEAEEDQLARIKEELNQISLLSKAEMEELEATKNALLAQAQLRSIQLAEREELNEEQYNEIVYKEMHLKDELQQRLNELNEKEKLTEAEFAELKRRELQLIRIKDLHEIETKNSNNTYLARIMEQQKLLLLKNQQLMEGHVSLDDNLRRLDQDLQGASQVETITESNVNVYATQLVGEN